MKTLIYTNSIEIAEDFDPLDCLQRPLIWIYIFIRCSINLLTIFLFIICVWVLFMSSGFSIFNLWSSWWRSSGTDGFGKSHIFLSIFRLHHF